VNLDLDRALLVARNAAQAAGELIDHYYARGVDVRIKADATPVTQADEDSERVIREILLATYPDHAIYGEEGGRTGDGDYLWLVDPIDGTKSFVRGYPMFSTQIALMYRGELVLGVSHASAFRETAWARRGGGAFLNGVPCKVASPPPIGQRPRCPPATSRPWPATRRLEGTRRSGPRRPPHPRLRRFPALPPARAGASTGHRERRQHPRHRRAGGHPARSRRRVHRSLRRRRGSGDHQRARRNPAMHAHALAAMGYVKRGR
jgi:hypothetical protein